jgi:hypothetical protein
VNGWRTPYVAKARQEAERARTLLTAALTPNKGPTLAPPLPTPLPVRPLIVVVGAVPRVRSWPHTPTRFIGSIVTATVSLNRQGAGLGLAVAVEVEVPAVPRAQAEERVALTRQRCPYSITTRCSDIPVSMIIASAAS